MNDDDEIQEAQESEPPAYGQSPQIAMDEAFCLRMRAAIEAGLESAPIGVVTTPGTKNPRHVPTKPLPLPSARRAMEDA